MSLLLDALKDADGRRNKPSGATAAAAAPKPRSDSQVLSILEDPVPGAAQPAAVAPAATQSASRAEPVTVEIPTRRQLAAGSERQPGATRRFLLPTLLVVTILVIGAGYKYLSGSQDLPELMPASLPAPTAATTSEALQFEADAAEEAPVGGHVHLEPGLELDAPPRADVVAAPVPPAPEPVQAQTPSAIQTVRSTLVVEQSAGVPLQRAYDALRAGDLATAEAGYREVLREAPHQVDAHLGLAVIAQARGSVAVALSHYRAVLDSVPDHARAWSGLSDLAGEQELDGMESRLRGLIARRPAATLQFALGNVLARQSRWAEAQEYYFRAASGEPGNAEYAFNLAVALDHLGKRDATVTWYGRALDLARDGRPVQFDTASATQRLTALREPSQ